MYLKLFVVFGSSVDLRCLIQFVGYFDSLFHSFVIHCSGLG